MQAGAFAISYTKHAQLETRSESLRTPTATRERAQHRHTRQEPRSRPQFACLKPVHTFALECNPIRHDRNAFECVAKTNWLHLPGDPGAPAICIYFPIIFTVTLYLHIFLNYFMIPFLHRKLRKLSPCYKLPFRVRSAQNNSHNIIRTLPRR